MKFLILIIVFYSHIIQLLSERAEDYTCVLEEGFYRSRARPKSETLDIAPIAENLRRADLQCR